MLLGSDGGFRRALGLPSLDPADVARRDATTEEKSNWCARPWGHGHELTWPKTIATGPRRSVTKRTDGNKHDNSRVAPSLRQAPSRGGARLLERKLCGLDGSHHPWLLHCCRAFVAAGLCCTWRLVRRASSRSIQFGRQCFHPTRECQLNRN